MHSVDTNRTGSHRARYTTVAIVLHWLIAALLIFEVGLGLRMEAAHGPAKFVVFQLHKSIGITILLLVVLRLLWRLMRTPPAILARPWERALAHVVHIGFYIILFAMPLSGWVIVSTSRIVVPTLLYGTVPWPHFPGTGGLADAAKAAWHDPAEFIHVNLVYVIYAFFALHVAGALKHHFLDQDGDIARMAPGARAGRLDLRLTLILGGALLAAWLGRGLLPLGPVAATTAVAEAPPAPATPVAPQPPVTEAAAAPAPPTAAVEEPVADEPAANATEAVKAGPSSWAIGKGSTLQFRTSWSGAAIAGGFRKFEGDIDFGPDALDKSRVEIRVDTGSVFSGDDQRDETLKSADWFSVASFATATFSASKFRKVGADRYVANGTLKLKGVSLPIALPFTLRIKGDAATMQGSATLDRTAYKIGEGDYASTSEIPADVTVDVVIKATRK